MYNLIKLYNELSNKVLSESDRKYLRNLLVLYEVKITKSRFILPDKIIDTGSSIWFPLNKSKEDIIYTLLFNRCKDIHYYMQSLRKDLLENDLFKNLLKNYLENVKGQLTIYTMDKRNNDWDKLSDQYSNMKIVYKPIETVVNIISFLEIKMDIERIMEIIIADNKCILINFNSIWRGCFNNREAVRTFMEDFLLNEEIIKL